MLGLGYAMRSIPLGTAYAVWVGIGASIGASITAGYAMASGSEPASVAKVLLLGGIVACVIGLKVLE
jgi:quaternary ammonium compound-resistance protein SugE